MADVNFVKPKVALVGQDGNIFNLIGICSKALKRAGYPDKAKEMSAKAMASHSYGEALCVLLDYVEEEYEEEYEDEYEDEYDD